MRAAWCMAAGALICLQMSCSSSRVRFVHADEWTIQGRYAALADRRIFAVMAFLNAVGYDEEIPGYQMHPLRLRVRELVRRNTQDCPEKVADWKMWYESHVASDTREGFVLTAPLHALLEDYEKSGQPFDGYLPVLLEKLPELSPDAETTAEEKA